MMYSCIAFLEKVGKNGKHGSTAVKCLLKHEQQPILQLEIMIRIVAFGDIHMALGRFQDIPAIESADTIILTGDLTNFGTPADAKKILDQILAVNPNVLAQIGNLDELEIDDYLQELDMNLHGQARVIGGQACFFGVGGSNIAPFKAPAEFSEKEIAHLLKKAYSKATEFIALGNRDKMPLILVAHAPPLGTRVDKLPNGAHVGSSAVREFIERVQPDLCLTGHIHEGKGDDRLGNTPVINPGMIKDGGWVDLVIDGSTVTATLQ